MIRKSVCSSLPGRLGASLALVSLSLLGCAAPTPQPEPGSAVAEPSEDETPPLVIIQPVADSATAGAWGDLSAGLRCRTWSPDVAAIGDWLELPIEFSADVSALGDGIDHLASDLVYRRSELVLSHLATGRQTRIRCIDLEAGRPDPPLPGNEGRRFTLLREATPAVTRVRFALGRAFAILEPGVYAAHINCTFDDPNLDSAAPPAASRFWRGTLRSGTVQLRLSPIVTYEQTITIPTALRRDANGVLEYVFERRTLARRRGAKLSLSISGYAEVAGGPSGSLHRGGDELITESTWGVPGNDVVRIRLTETGDPEAGPRTPSARHADERTLIDLVLSAE